MKNKNYFEERKLVHLYSTRFVCLLEPVFLTGYLLSYDAISLLNMDDEKQKKQEYQQKIFSPVAFGGYPEMAGTMRQY